MLSKTQIEKLNVDQKATLAEVELRLAQARRKLLQQARGYSNRSRFITALLLVLPIFCFIAFHRGGYLPMVWLFMFLAWVIRIQADINRRMDALIELLDFDMNGVAREKKIDDENESQG